VNGVNSEHKTTPSHGRAKSCKGGKKQLGGGGGGVNQWSRWPPSRKPPFMVRKEWKKETKIGETWRPKTSESSIWAVGSRRTRSSQDQQEKGRLDLAGNNRGEPKMCLV